MVTKNAKVLALLDGFIFVHRATLVKIIASNTDANEQEARAIIETALSHDKKLVERTARKTNK